MLAQLSQFGANKYFIHVNKLTDVNFVINIKNNTTLILLQKYYQIILSNTTTHHALLAVVIKRTGYGGPMMYNKLTKKIAVAAISMQPCLQVLHRPLRLKPQKPVELVIMAGQGGGDRIARLFQSIIQKEIFPICQSFL